MSAASRARAAVVPFLAGALFAVGLVFSGMTQPAKVSGFLDVTGDWDPSLAFVMIGAIGVHLVARRLILRRSAPIAAATFDEPKVTRVDAPLVLGAAIFGVGWGLGGYCPGPALVTLGSGSLQGVLFVVSMGAGIGVHRLVRPALSRLGRTAPALRAPIALRAADG